MWYDSGPSWCHCEGLNHQTQFILGFILQWMLQLQFLYLLQLPVCALEDIQCNCVMYYTSSYTDFVIFAIGLVWLCQRYREREEENIAICMKSPHQCNYLHPWYAAVFDLQSFPLGVIYLIGSMCESFPLCLSLSPSLSLSLLISSHYLLLVSWDNY